MASAIQAVVRRRGQDTCIHHTGKIIAFLCENCSEVACMKCVGSRHKGHDLTELSDIAEQQKIEMIKFISEVENNRLPNMKDSIESVEKLKADTTNYFNKLETTVQDQGDKLKQAIDVLIAKSSSLCRRLKEDNIQLLNDYKKCLSDIYEGLGKQLHECKTQLQDASVLELFDTGHAFRSLALNLPDKPRLHTVVFEAPAHYQPYLEEAFGTLTTDDQGQPDSTLQPGAPTEDRSSSGTVMAKRQEVNYNLSHQTNILGKFNTKGIGNKVCATEKEEIWISYSNSLQLLSKKGEIRREIKFNVRITDVCISPRTKKIWICSDTDSSIMDCALGVPNLRFNCKSKPICLCVTAANHVLVGMSQKVTKFSQKGEPLLSTKTTTSGKPIVRLPQKIAECRLTQNLAVVERQSYDEYNTKQVLVMNKEFEELFRYKGGRAEGQKTAEAIFDPWDVTFDNAGNLLIADCNNHRVLLVSCEGEFLRTVFTDERSAQAICIDRSLILWAVFGDEVKRLQYYSG
ncbi:uncharacterized protein LOC132558096 [Ylistrum balloti]|uniref:uncharacterized protein LOC132558096 n=1 Tax=Ylistrum balloti TaxID=509963 RepID=UPI002905E950|nr:uncharacterized protein LOC132558096 [Ylistrum balloti]